MIDSIVIYSDAMNSILIKDIEYELLNTSFKMEFISKKLDNINCKMDEKNMIFEIKEWLKSKIG